LFEGSRQGGSQFWKSLHKIKHFFKLGAKHMIGDGRRTCFWTDWWIRDRPLKEIFPNLFSICENPTQSVAAVLDSGAQGASVAFHKDVWEAKVPLKIKIFSWQLILDRLPSSQQIATRHGPATGNCSLCGAVEDAGHIFF
jgi:hypothetical protein